MIRKPRFPNHFRSGTVTSEPLSPPIPPQIPPGYMLRNNTVLIPTHPCLSGPTMLITHHNVDDYPVVLTNHGRPIHVQPPKRAEPDIDFLCYTGLKVVLYCIRVHGRGNFGASAQYTKRRFLHGDCCPGVPPAFESSGMLP